MLIVSGIGAVCANDSTVCECTSRDFFTVYDSVEKIKTEAFYGSRLTVYYNSDRLPAQQFYQGDIDTEEESQEFLFMYKMDDRGNWIQRSTVENGVVIQVTKRTLSYY